MNVYLHAIIAILPIFIAYWVGRTWGRQAFVENMLTNSDQFVEWDSNEFMYSMTADNIDGGIVSFKATHPKWSFAKLNKDGFIRTVEDKNGELEFVPISEIVAKSLRDAYNYV